MFDVLKTLSGLVKIKRSAAGPKAQDSYLSPVDHREQAKKVTSQKTVKTPGHPVAKAEPSVAFPPEEVSGELRSLETKAKELILEAKDEALRILREAEGDMRKKTELIDRRVGMLESREEHLRQQEVEKQKILEKLEAIQKEQLKNLERTAKLTSDEAKAMLLGQLHEKLTGEIAREIERATAQAHEEAEKKAQEILVDAMRHGATDYVAEYTVSVIKIKDEDVKGRIIGKEGRNIRAFETATGVDVDLDEEGVIRLSCFDPVRREIARVTLERLLRDGRVQPGRIEDIIAQVKKEIDRIMFEEGQKLCHAVSVYNLPPPLVALLGRFKYRFSYGQNMIAHTLEETKIGIALAGEVGADVNVVRLGCLLHDVGKVIVGEEGNHIELGVNALKKYGMPQKVIDCVAQHHEDIPFSSIESVLVYIADAISGSRPGARYENYEEYVKRLSDLEAIAKSQSGVEEAFAFQAGRELRVIVDPGKVSDSEATVMAQTMKEEIEKKVTYPGQVKITVVRELRAVEVAK
ncbi:ribonuclease Y [Patescibacteria group bacterium]|nr:ribonuclease Y [Patescibacteria group bacterium]MBU1472270.1 ribonuclease Y [Patescibacteria group bacterium]MBU2460479.1 ribonuclease Y [Patescibacteria group bacterium]MBU2544014.1 ribonuclease Y [Patescibacteria group bacterium]